MFTPIYKVLVADDDESVRESLRKLLLDEGYEVIAVANGEDAVKTFRLKQDQIDLLLVDLNMPLKNGWATLDRLLEINPSLPVLIITGQSNQYEMAEATGVSALVEKPIDVPALIQVMRKLLTEPVQSLTRHAGRRESPLQLVCASGYKSPYSWSEQSIVPHSHGGLNE